MAKKLINRGELVAYRKMLAENPDALTKKQKDELRSMVLDGEAIKVRYTGRLGGFHNGKIIEAIPRAISGSGLPYPLPKHIGYDFRVTDEDGDSFRIAKKMTDKLYEGFERVIGR